MKRLLLIGLLGLGACSDYPTTRPLAVDGPRNANFAQDEAECYALASNYNPGEMAGSIGAGAAEGALVGALTSGRGSSTEWGLKGAAIGGLMGAAEGQYETDKAQRQVMINCMQGRGHRVIG